MEIIALHSFITNESVNIKFEFVFAGVYKNMNNFEIQYCYSFIQMSFVVKEINSVASLSSR